MNYCFLRLKKMEQSFADLLSDAFSDGNVTETAAASFPDEDLDFENVNVEQIFEADKTDIFEESVVTKEDGDLQPEATCQTAVLSSMETIDINMEENVDVERWDDKSEEEDFEGGKVMNRDKTPEQDYSSSDGETEEIGSGEDEEDEEDTTTEFYDGNKADRIFTEGQPLGPEGAETPQVRKKEQGESESDEEVSYFERVPECGSEMIIRDDGNEGDVQEREKEKDSCDSEREGMKIEQEGAVFALCCDQKLESPCVDGPAKANLEFPEISVQNLQDLIAEVDIEKNGEKIKDFLGEEHQDAGESFADYPSDFSSCEYVEDGGRNQEKNSQSKTLASITKQKPCQESAVTDAKWMGRAEDTDEERDGYLYSRDLEVDVNEFRSLYVAEREKDSVDSVYGKAAVTAIDDGGATGESDSYTSSDDEFQEKWSDEKLLDCVRLQDLESNKQLEETRGGRGAAFSGNYNTVDPADFNNYWSLEALTTDTLLSEDLLTTADTDDVDTPLSDVTQRSAEEMVQRGDARTKNPSDQGSLDDSFFFFNTEPEASGIMETGHVGEDEYEEERNWEQEQKRINAFYEFYDDSDEENEREGRQIKVQFCADPLSQVIHYETDSSDRASLSSSTDEEEDVNSAETSEKFREPGDATIMSQACDPPNTQLPENMPDVSNTHMCTKKHKCFNILKLTLKMALVILTGLLMFWFATDQVGWFSHVSLF